MTHEIVRHLLEDYADEALAEDASASVRSHIADCEICNADVAAIREMSRRAKQMPPSVTPPPAIWNGIRSAIESEAPETVSRQRPWLSRPMLAAAGLVIAAVSSLLTATAVGRSPRAPTGPVAVAARNPSSQSASGSSALAEFTIQENDYLKTASALADVLERQQASLSPETVAQLRKSLRVIDDAILEARNALARDPANRVIVEMLKASYAQKIDLLRRTTEMSASS
jgi:anti-sigma factor RsiW